MAIVLGLVASTVNMRANRKACPQSDRPVAGIVAFYESLLQRDATNAVLRRSLGDVHLAAFILQSERLLVRECAFGLSSARNNPADTDVLVGLPTPVEGLFIPGTYQEALRPSDEAGKSPQSLFHLDRAIDLYWEAINLEPSSSSGWFIYAWALQRRGDHAAALPAYRQTIELAWPNDDLNTAPQQPLPAGATRSSAGSPAAPFNGARTPYVATAANEVRIVFGAADWRQPTLTEVAIGRVLPLLGPQDGAESARLAERAALLEARRQKASKNGHW